MGWIPPFLVGMAGATSGELTGWLLLYADDGFIRALTAILFAELLALGLGLGTAGHLRPNDAGAVRGRWLLALLSFTPAVVFATGWGLTGGYSASALSQGFGLALLGAVPLFAIGALLGALSMVEEDSGPVALPAMLGAAVAVLAIGAFGLREFRPASLYLFCVMAVSGGALLHGGIAREIPSG